MRRVVLAISVAAGLACTGAVQSLDEDVRAAARAKAVQACKSAADGLPKNAEGKVCNCVADEVVGKLSAPDLADMVKNGPDPSKIKTAVKRCANKAR